MFHLSTVLFCACTLKLSCPDQHCGIAWSNRCPQYQHITRALVKSRWLYIQFSSLLMAGEGRIWILHILSTLYQILLLCPIVNTYMKSIKNKNESTGMIWPGWIFLILIGNIVYIFLPLLCIYLSLVLYHCLCDLLMPWCFI